MHIYCLLITLQDPLYFATRELGRLYVTEQYLHNYALTYALGLAKSNYYDAEHIPHYERELEPLNQQGIYITPARPLNSAYVTHTYKFANLSYHVKMDKISKNIPTFGRIRELAPESRFEFFVISQKELKLPKWIRLGKWMSKAEVTVEPLPKHKISEGIFTCTHPLNPLDVMFTNQVISYDVVNMPPVSLIQNVQMRGQYYQFDDIQNLKIPVRIEYRFQS
ncbi:type I-D CRISPR-associated protein Cas5/Csc1 [Nostoc cf. edaphicum LEGE 07299]|uniref:Type I-D CRISPR-associated protein Cas5/Csc1 n=1 Tax=Nostoc cf. edaphicum LEGE 07299 TaxID=2777974 RepID=A0ABR9U477_9NOSO|nr:type I-D CRISPR-associated protein Cas5/Csc1 [Nostoc edaphicum]MBE9107454.1 type I-D CRISPR-associated protein Cas5/Csc1 [Nostoc cf. edaphicum LEGE 07299]